MDHDVCPWWLGYLLVSPVRRLRHSPRKILSPYIHEGMTILEPGPGMGFFTIEAGRLAGPNGRVVAIEVQQRMIDGLRRRVRRRHLAGRIDLRLAQPDDMGITDLRGKVDFVLAFAVVHEMPDKEKFFRECSRVLRPGGKMLFSEPSAHIDEKEFEESLVLARKAGLFVDDTPPIPSGISAVLVKNARRGRERT